MKYELFYNVDYAREHNPRLMQFGRTGGFGCGRASMLKAVKGGDMKRAEQYFWELIIETIDETNTEYALVEDSELDELLDEWFEALMTDPRHESDEKYFVRVATPYQRLVTHRMRIA